MEQRTRRPVSLAAALAVVASLVTTDVALRAGAVGAAPPPTTVAAPSPRSFEATGPTLRLGSRGAPVRALQQRLVALHFWVGRVDGVFGDSTQQAVYAVQKAAGLPRDGVVGATTRRALARGVTATPRPARGRLIEIDLRRQLLLVVSDGSLVAALNTSTGGGYSYSSGGLSGVAVTPRGVFRVYRQVNAWDVSPLGQLWRPKYFYSGYAVHGSLSVPATPVSHGCVRVSVEAMDWIWATNRMPVGTRVRIF